MTDTLMDLVERVETGERSNELDVLIEVALFEPDENWTAVRANSAGTKVIYTHSRGHDRTHWAPDWSADDPDSVIASLKARMGTVKQENPTWK